MKVLMLGWEFPPLFSGGLGVATYGIVKALGKLSEVRLIVPTAGAATNLSGARIIGLNQLTANEVDLEKLNIESLLSGVQSTSVPVAISPYHFENEWLRGRMDDASIPQESLKKIETIRSIFSGAQIYGADILFKINLFAQLVGELTADGDFDLVHAHDWVTYPAAMRIKQRTGKPMIAHVHALETDRAGDHARNEIYWIERKGLEEADHIVSVSEYTREQIIRHYEIEPDKISVVHNGIDPAPVTRKRHHLKDKLVVFLGRITQQKGPHFLLETAEKVVRVYPRVKFVVAGMGDQFAHLLEETAYKKLGNKFIFTGFLTKTKVDDLLAMAGVYFMPSLSEPFGLSALEAAQHLVPSVISSQSGAAEVITSSLQADFWDTDKYANYIHALLKYDALGKELSSHALRQLDKLSWDHAAQKLMVVYKSLPYR